MNQTHTSDFEGQAQCKPSIYIPHTVSFNNARLLCLIYRLLYCWMLLFLSSTPFFLFFPLSIPTLLSMQLVFPSVLTFCLSLRPIFCLIAPISFASHCPNSESVHFDLREHLVGMMYCLLWLTVGHAHQPTHQNRLAACEILPAKKGDRAFFFLL